MKRLSGVSWGFPKIRRRQVGVHILVSRAAQARRDHSIASIAQEESNRLQSRSPGRERLVARGSAPFSCCIILGNLGQEARRRSFATNSRCTLSYSYSYITRQITASAQAIDTRSLHPRSTRATTAASSNNNRSINRAMTGTLTSVGSLAICLGMTTTSAFVLLVPKVTPLPDPAWTKQASSSLGGPLGDDGDKTGAGCAFSRIRRRSTCPLNVFKGVEVRTYCHCIDMHSLQTLFSACKETVYLVPGTTL